MMMMPFIRLLAIYALVGAAIFAFLKRDALMDYFATPEAVMVAPSESVHAEANPTSQQNTTADASATEAAPQPAPQPVAQPSAAPTTPAQPAINPAQPAFGSQITPQYFEQATAPTVTPAPAAPRADSLMPRWTNARKVFGQGHFDEAARLYEALILDFPNNIDLRGETGNLYYNLGQFSKAAVHYQAVGEIAGRAGNRQLASSMLSLLQRIAPTKAAELQATLNAGQ